LPLDRVRRSVEQLGVAMQDLAAQSDVIVCDAETDSDLATVAGASLRLRSKVIWAGTAGLARHVIEAAGLARSPPVSPAPTLDGSIVFVVGSRSSVSRRQAATLAAPGGVVSLESDPTCSWDELHSSGVAGRLAATLAVGDDAIIWQPGGSQQIEAMEARPYGLARLLAAHECRIGALFATGGDTARCLLDALDVQALELRREIEPGVPLSIAIGPRRFPVITKAGGFGTDATMTRCRSWLRCGASLSSALETRLER
jgi:D-threonate/D-erythronate kinase